MEANNRRVKLKYSKVINRVRAYDRTAFRNGSYTRFTLHEINIYSGIDATTFLFDGDDSLKSVKVTTPFGNGLALDDTYKADFDDLRRLISVKPNLAKVLLDKKGSKLLGLPYVPWPNPAIVGWDADPASVGPK